MIPTRQNMTETIVVNTKKDQLSVQSRPVDSRVTVSRDGVSTTTSSVPQRVNIVTSRSNGCVLLYQVEILISIK